MPKEAEDQKDVIKKVQTSSPKGAGAADAIFDAGQTDNLFDNATEMGADGAAGIIMTSPIQPNDPWLL
jgi:hypothetical protein